MPSKDIAGQDGTKAWHATSQEDRMTATAEQWAKIPGWPYEVSNAGEIRRNGRTLKPTIRDGYSQICLVDGTRRLCTCINRLMLIAFVSLPTNGQQSRHLNGDRQDNRLCNLVWGTAQENIDDRDHHGMTARGQKNGGAKLSWAQVVEIRCHYDDHMKWRLANGFQRAKRGFCIVLARRFNTTQSSINRIVTRSAW